MNKPKTRKRHAWSLPMLLPLVALALLCSCKTTAPQYDYRELARASIRLGIDIGMKDNHRLYIEAANWIGTPYRYGGNTRKGIDCSGFTSQIYKTVYRKTLSRSSEQQRKNDCQRIPKRKLHEGDLVFFATGKPRRKATHVGIYLKDGQFIHASTRNGVTVDHLNAPYYRQHWLSAGRVK